MEIANAMLSHQGEYTTSPPLLSVPFLSVPHLVSMSATSCNLNSNGLSLSHTSIATTVSLPQKMSHFETFHWENT